MLFSYDTRKTISFSYIKLTHKKGVKKWQKEPKKD